MVPLASIAKSNALINLLVVPELINSNEFQPTKRKEFVKTTKRGNSNYHYTMTISTDQKFVDHLLDIFFGLSFGVCAWTIFLVLLVSSPRVPFTCFPQKKHQIAINIYLNKE